MATLALLLSTTSLLDGRAESRVEFRTDTPAAAADDASDSSPSIATDDATGPDDERDATVVTTTSPSSPADTEADRWTRLPEPEAGVVSITQLDGHEAIATGILVDGRLLTSWSALEGAERVLIHHDDVVQEVLVRGSDAFADIAVLIPVDSEPLSIDHGFESATEVPPTDAQVHLVASDGKPQPIIVEGHILGSGQRATTRSGYTILGAMHTSARVPELAAGAALLDDGGRVVGMIIDVEDYLAVAVPIDRVQRIAESILESGWPDLAWVGLKGESSQDGITVTGIEPEGPAAKAGLHEGDRITRIGNKQVTDVAELVSIVRSTGPGATVQFEIVTDETTWSAYVVVAAREPVEAVTGVAPSN